MSQQQLLYYTLMLLEEIKYSKVVPINSPVLGKLKKLICDIRNSK